MRKRIYKIKRIVTSIVSIVVVFCLIGAIFLSVFHSFSDTSQVFIVQGADAGGSTYYVSIDGNDATGDGSEGNPWRTIDYGVSQMSSDGGDEVIIREGRYYESVASFVSGTQDNFNIIKNCPGEQVILDGSELVEDWSLYEPSIYKATVSFQSNLIFKGDNQLVDALEPDVGFFENVEADPSDTSKLVSSDFEQFSNEDLTGAVLYLYRSYFHTPRYSTQYEILENGENWVTLDFDSSDYDFKSYDYSFVLKNHKSFIDEIEEYFIDNDNSDIYLFSDSTPENIYASKLNRAIDFSAKQYITISGLKAIKNNERSLHIRSGSHNIIVENMYFSDDNAQNIYIGQSDDIELRDISLEKSNSYNIYTNQVTNLVLENFLIYGGNGRYAVFLDNTDQFTVQGFVVKDCLKSGFIIDESEDGYLDDISIEREFSDYSFDNGIYIPGSTNIFLSDIVTSYGLSGSLCARNSGDITLDGFDFTNTIEEMRTITIDNVDSFIIKNGYIANTLERAIYITHSFNGILDSIELVNTHRGIDITGGSEYIVVQNSYAHDMFDSGGSAFANHEAKHITFQNNIVTNWYSNGFLSEGYWDIYRAENIMVRNNYIYHAGPLSDDDLSDSWMAGIWISDTDNSLFENNTIIQNRAINLRLDSSKNNVIKNNILIGQHAQGHEQTQKEISCVYFSSAGGTSTEHYAINNIFSHNTLFNCGDGITLDIVEGYEDENPTVEDNAIENNIFLDVKEHCVVLDIFQPNTIDNNLYYNSEGNYYFEDDSVEINSFEEYQSQTGYDLSSSIENPYLQNMEIYDEIEFFENRNNYFFPSVSSPLCAAASDGGCIGAIPCPTCWHCNNNIQDGDETGVDCGGSCDPCEDDNEDNDTAEDVEDVEDVVFEENNTADNISCNNGIMDGNETGVDCGGDCDPCIPEEGSDVDEETDDVGDEEIEETDNGTISVNDTDAVGLFSLLPGLKKLDRIAVFALYGIAILFVAVTVIKISLKRKK